MQVIGAGFGRTGTLSIKKALEQLGFGPCYHMLEVLKNFKHVKYWQAAAEGKAVEWDELFQKYNACVDFPASIYYQQLFEAYPDAKVLLSVRDPERWHASTLETIYQGSKVPGWLNFFLPPIAKAASMVDKPVWEEIFDGRFEDRVYAIQVFKDWISEVKRNIPAERLLIFDVKDGWEPLCSFLGVSIPDSPFPHVNDRATIRRFLFLGRALGFALPIGILLGVVWVAIKLF